MENYKNDRFPIHAHAVNILFMKIDTCCYDNKAIKGGFDML